MKSFQISFDLLLRLLIRSEAAVEASGGTERYADVYPCAGVIVALKDFLLVFVDLYEKIRLILRKTVLLNEAVCRYMDCP